MRGLRFVSMLVAFLLMSATAFAQSATTTVTPVAFTFFSTCTGETVVGSAEMHTTTRTADGHQTTHTDLVGPQGVGVLSGGAYKFHEIAESSTNTQVPQYEETIEESMHVLRLQNGGSEVTDDFYFRAKFHITFNAKGELTADVTDFFFDCR